MIALGLKQANSISTTSVTKLMTKKPKNETGYQDYTFTDDKKIIDTRAVYNLLHSTYWAKNRPLSAVKKSIKNSICFSVFLEKKQIGFIRAISDEATYTAILDLVIHKNYRGRGLGKKLVEFALKSQKIRTTKKILWTKDAEKLYKKYGFYKNNKMKVLFQDPQWASFKIK